MGENIFPIMLLFIVLMWSGVLEWNGLVLFVPIIADFAFYLLKAWCGK